MIDSNRQFSIATLAEWTAIAASLVALAIPQTGLSMLFISFLVSACVAFRCWRMGLKPIATGAITGFSGPAALLFGIIVSTVLKAELVQGHLYCEDGPGVFFAGCAIFLIIFGGLLSILGAISGAAFQFGSRYHRHEKLGTQSRSADRGG